eukprot:COSAG01_NODE_1585_length_9810_cov_8.980435_11_plen_77_part_00
MMRLLSGRRLASPLVHDQHRAGAEPLPAGALDSIYDALMMRRARHLLATAPQSCCKNLSSARAARPQVPSRLTNTP